MSPPLDDHGCGWKTYAEQLRAAHDKSSADIREQLAEVKRLLYARKSEKRRKSAKLPPPLPPDPVDPMTIPATRAKARAQRRAADRDRRGPRPRRRAHLSGLPR